MSAPKILSVGDHSHELAPEHVIEAMFTTIACRLEARGRGTRFPVVMDDLYAGYLKPVRALAALGELQEIEAGLRSLPVGRVVWNNADEPVTRQAANALEFFVDERGRPLICRLREGVQECLSTVQVLRLDYRRKAGDVLLGGLLLIVPGVIWMLVGRAYFAHWNLAPVYNRKAGIPVWTFGMDLLMLGVAFMIHAAFPGLREWFRRRPVALVAVAIFAVIGWLAVCARAGFIPD